MILLLSISISLYLIGKPISGFCLSQRWFFLLNFFFLFFCRHASGCPGNFSHDPPWEAGHDVQCYLEQRDPSSLPQVHARRKYPSTFSSSTPCPLPPPLPCPLPPDSLVLQAPRKGHMPIWEWWLLEETQRQRQLVLGSARVLGKCRKTWSG